MQSLPPLMQESTTPNPTMYTPKEVPLKRLLKLLLKVIDNWLENHYPPPNKKTNETNQKTIRCKHEKNPITPATFSWSDETHKLSLEKNVKQLSNFSEHFEDLYIE